MPPWEDCASTDKAEQCNQIEDGLSIEEGETVGDASSSSQPGKSAEGDNFEYLKHHGDLARKQSQRPEEKGRDKDDKEKVDEDEAVPLLDRLMLVSSLFSIEMCMSFMQLYEIL
ncbi:hypothetical protein EGW08_005740, partial [Elysia chlorotica]